MVLKLYLWKIRYAKQEDVNIVLSLIKELAAYEKMSAEVVATEALLSQWLFEKKIIRSDAT